MTYLKNDPDRLDVTLKERRSLLPFKNKVLWFTGMSGAGKSTLAHELENSLHLKGFLTYVLDGDVLRQGLNSDLRFTPKDRKENLRRVAHVARLLYESGIFVIVAFISPYAKSRDFARKLIGSDFIEVFVDCPLEICQQRDIKGLYQKAKNNEISNFTGISAPYEKPTDSEIIIKTNKLDIKQSVKKIVDYIEKLEDDG